MKELEGIVIRKYNISEVIPIIPTTPQFDYSSHLGSILLIDRMCYEVDVNGQLYELITHRECELPERAKIRIEKSGRILKDTYLLYENKKISCN